MKDLTGELGYEARVLMLGCGNSGLSEVVRYHWMFEKRNLADNQMYDAGWKNIVNVDVRSSLLAPSQLKAMDSGPRGLC